MNDHMPIYIGNQAIAEFVNFCKKEKLSKYFLIADENTFQVLGKTVREAVLAQGWDLTQIILDPEGLHADDLNLTRVLNAYDAQPRTFLAVGSGTITDTARFTSHRSQNQFISFPTAASVDAYTSKNAPVTIGNLKGSIYCHAPIAIFTHIPTICESPKFLTASGFGDLVSKLTSSSDWKYTHLLWGSKFDQDIYDRALAAGQTAANLVKGIAAADPDSMAGMMQGQFDSGFCMADFGQSDPASGGEHHIAHIWEMMAHWEHREGLFHGNAVGVATIMEARWYEKLRSLSRDEAFALIEKATVPGYEEQAHDLQENIPEIAQELIESNPIYMQLSDPEKLDRVKDKMRAHWEEIQATAALVPSPQDLEKWLVILGGPTTPEELDFSAEQIRLARDYGLYLRARFSINIIRKMFGW